MTRRVCYACGARAETGARCSCGEPLWVAAQTTEAWPATGDASLWRYRDLLPVDPPPGLGAAVGGTPLVRAPRLDDVAGGATVRVKFEGAHPTGTFKDRGTAVGVAGALERGVGAVATVSHGNMARSVAAHAASEGLDCVVCVPADVPAERLATVARHDPTILRVDGDYGRLYGAALSAGREADVAVINSDTPLRVAGQKTTGLEILEGSDPDAVVMPVSSGGHASGVWKAIREATASGLVDDPPRLYLAQAAGCAPVAAAYDRGEREVTRIDPGETVAYSIANADPPSGTRALAAARETGGAVLAVDDDAIFDCRSLLAERAGLFVETSCATPLAAARDLADRGEIAGDETVALVATGTGYTERDVGDAPTPEAEVVDLERLPDALRGAVGG
ncbi:MAG: threonine synthase [Haloferacaceae archaeon]